MAELERLLKAKEVEALAGIGPTKRNQERAAGRLLAVKIGRATRYPESAVRAFIANLPPATLVVVKG